MASRMMLQACVVLLVGRAVAQPDSQESEEVCLLQAARLKREVASEPGEAFNVETVVVEEKGDRVGYKVLHNKATGESVDIAYTYGGKVDSIKLRSPVSGDIQELVVSSGRNATKFINMGWAANSLLMPFANRIDNGTYTLDNVTYYMERTGFPNAIHGFLIGMEMSVVSESGGGDSASVTLAYELNKRNASDPESHPQGYPFHLYFEATYTLDKKGLTVTPLARNLARDGGPLPFYMGMHPYFVVTDVSKSEVLLDACSQWNRIGVGKTMIPTEKTTPSDEFQGKPIGGTLDAPTHWDDGFKATASTLECPTLTTEVYDPSRGDSSVLWMSQEFRWVQAFTGGTPDLGQVIAIEPMSGETDAFNNHQAGTLLIQAGETWSGTFGFQIRKPSDRAFKKSSY